MTYTYQDGILYFYFSGDLDHLHVSRMKEKCIQLIEKYQPKQVKMDFQAVSFVDSTGIGFVLARYKQLSKFQAKLTLCNLSRANERLFQMSGIFQIIELERNEVNV